MFMVESFASGSLCCLQSNLSLLAKTSLNPFAIVSTKSAPTAEPSGTDAPAESTSPDGVAVEASNPETFSQHPLNEELSPERKVELFTQLVRIRRFEERAVRAYQQGKIGGFLHDYIGQESIAVGAVSVMGEHDHVITAYRDHGHALAVGMGMNELMAELFGKYTGCSKGKGGSMHFFAPDKHFWGGHGIVGGQTPLGAGLAYALKYKGIKGAALCFLGDGAVNQGAFHESLNLASLWDLPVVYVIENNGYSMGTSQKRSSAFTDCLAKRAEGYAMEWDIGFGHNLYEVRARVGKALINARENSRPMILELATYRYRGHSIADANKEKYRTKEEIREARERRDPITVFRNLLLAEGIIDEDKAKEIDKAARQEAEASVDFADASPYPPEEEITRDVYWETDNPDQQTNQGRFFFND